MRPQKVEIKLITKEKIATTVYEFQFLINSETKFYFTPGQFINIRLTDRLWRSYSIVSIKKNILTLLIDLKQRGQGTKLLKAAELNTNYTAMLPLGKFQLTGSDLPKVFVATGTGLAPFIPMIKELSDQNFNKEIWLLFGARYDQDNYAKSYFEFGELLDTFNLIPCLTKPTSDIDCEIGRVTEILPRLNIQLRNYEFYLCGNPNMIGDVKLFLTDNNIEQERIIYEEY